MSLTALIALVSIAAGSARAGQVIVGSFDSVSVPEAGVPAVIWGGSATAAGTGPGTFTAPHELLPSPETGPVKAALVPAGDRSLIVAEPYVSSGASIRSAGVYFGTVVDSGAARLRRVLDGGDGPRAPFLAGSPAGDALLVFQHGEQAAVDRRSPGGRLRPPVVAGRFYVQDAAIDGQGTATLIGYRDPNALLVSSAARGGRFSPPEALSTSAAVAPRLAAGRNGQTAVVTAGSTDGVRLYYRPRPHAGFGPAQPVAGSGLRVVATAVGDDGRVLVAWTEIDASHRLRLRAMISDPAGRPTEPVWLSSADRDVWYGHAAAAMNGAGDAAAVWEEVTAPTATAPVGAPEVHAAFRPAGGDFGVSRQVTAPGRHSASIAPPTVAIGDDPAAIVEWADAVGDPDSDRRFMAATLTGAGLTAETRLDSAPPVAGPPATSPPLLKAGLSLPALRRMGAAGRLKLRVRCTSWTLEPCKGRIGIVSRAGHRRVAGRDVRLPPNAARKVTVRLRRRARHVLARGRTLRTTARVTLAGPDSAGAPGRLTLEPR